MTGPGGISWSSGRNERELLSRRRQEAGVRLARERARNSRRALVGFVVLAGLLGAGSYYGFSGFDAAPREEQLTAAQAAAKQFIETRTGDVRFNSLDGSICREVQFQNDTGRFFDNRQTRCDKTDENVVAPPGGLRSGLSDRALAIRQGFQKR